MDKKAIYTAGTTAACRFAAQYLRSLGLVIADSPGQHCGYLLLDVPSFGADGLLRSGERMQTFLSQLPADILICGGNLSHPSLDGYRTIDFLRDERYLCENAYITAECALDVAFPYLPRTIRGCPILIVGWGRIGKCLGQLLRVMGADVTIAARNPAHRAMIHAMGYQTADPAALDTSHYRLLFNTVPAPVLDRAQMDCCKESCIKIELASADGMDGEDIVIARGLPGIHMPESSGELIAETFLRLCYGR